MKLKCSVGICLVAALPLRAACIDLLKNYPTQLIDGDTAANQARPWQFTGHDIFQISSFIFKVGQLHLELADADLGIGHSEDGAVWAIIIPRTEGTLSSPANNEPAKIAHVWLRFHPGELARLFPDQMVQGGGDTNLDAQMTIIASVKFTSSWHAGINALIPAPKDLTVDVDTKDGQRRFFVVETQSNSAEYISAFEEKAVRAAPAATQDSAVQAFDALWTAFDREYAMFILRPEVNWDDLRNQYRPKALAAKSAYEFAEVCADMLKQLRDLHIWLRVAGAEVPVFDRTRTANANPAAHARLLGKLNGTAGVQWAITTNKVGYLAIYNWSRPEVVEECYQALNAMGDTRGLVLDVRLNGGGSEDLAQEVAGRFLPSDFVYAYSQFRNGPKHTDLTTKIERVVNPRGPWRYNRPVVLLIGQKCMSSNESFIAMMGGDPLVTTMGDHTCGSSGNPRMLDLPMDISVSIPRWIDYLPDGTALDEQGVQPQVPFGPGPGAFDGHRDDLLAAALARLNKILLPPKPIDLSHFDPN